MAERLLTLLRFYDIGLQMGCRVLPWGHLSISIAGLRLPFSPYYLLWWVVGLLPLLFDMLKRLRPQTMRIVGSDSTVLRLSQVYLMLPWIPFITHLCFNH